MGNEVKNSSGKVVGSTCSECGETKDKMWGDICNSCRATNARHAAIVKALETGTS